MFGNKDYFNLDPDPDFANRLDPGLDLMNLDTKHCLHNEENPIH
jgi:hypothetical protein